MSIIGKKELCPKCGKNPARRIMCPRCGKINILECSNCRSKRYRPRPEECEYCGTFIG